MDSLVPTGAVKVAFYHTHPYRPPNGTFGNWYADAEEFSSMGSIDTWEWWLHFDPRLGDIPFAIGHGVNMYLSTPSGNFLKFDLETRTVLTNEEWLSD